MARVKVKLNSPGMSSLLKDAGVAAELERRGQAVLNTARATAPVDTGEYRNSLFILPAMTDRAVCRIGTRAPHGMIVEFKSGNLAKALDAAGGA
ncbi:HK97 gp10 family phage protein [Aeromicrobium sp. HA]|uniref:HK97 gp10 family phage protein n=1 Tax=Aeromicrobium sp. HA TaxID=3009077 RepID=UPI0022AEA563|nr:hypothetical protein [Aeromicrobium sp. HA]